MEVNEYLNIIPPEKSRALISKLNSLPFDQRKIMLEKLRLVAASYTEPALRASLAAGQPYGGSQMQPSYGGGQMQPSYGGGRMQPPPRVVPIPEPEPEPEPEHEPYEEQEAIADEPLHQDEPAVVSRRRGSSGLFARLEGMSDIQKGFVMSEIFRIPMCKRKKRT